MRARSPLIGMPGELEPFKQPLNQFGITLPILAKRVSWGGAFNIFVDVVAFLAALGGTFLLKSVDVLAVCFFWMIAVLTTLVCMRYSFESLPREIAAARRRRR